MRISKADYFSKSKEFRTWLKRAKGTDFESLDADAARKKFKSFVEKWNDGLLEDMYYTGIPTAIADSATKTQHRWGFVDKLDDADRFKLEKERSFVSALTNYSKPGAPASAGAGATAPTAGAGAGTAGPSAGYGAAPSGGYGVTGGPGPSRSSHDARAADDEREARASKAALERKVSRDRTKQLLEEVAPKATPGSREAAMEKRMEVAGKLHGAARERESGIDGLEVGEGVLMGSGGSSDYQRALQQRQQREARLYQQRSEKLTAAQEKEKEVMAKLLAEVGFVPGQKITIKPRE